MVDGVGKLSYKAEFSQKKPFSNSIHKQLVFEHQEAISVLSPGEQRNRTVIFNRMVWLTQVEPEREFGTNGKLGMSSFQCRKRHLISTSEQRVMAVTK